MIKLLQEILAKFFIWANALLLAKMEYTEPGKVTAWIIPVIL